MKKILVVDNDKVILEFLTDILSKEGHQVLTAEDGLSALDILKDYTPDIILLDVVMPNIDGKKFCKIIRRNHKLDATYVAMLSAVALEEEIEIAELGANICIAKSPFREMAQNVLSVLEQSDGETSRDLSGQVLGIESISPRGITSEMLTAKRHFEVILAKMSEGILEITSEGRIIYANPAALSLIGLPEETLLGSQFLKLFSEDDRQRIDKLLSTKDAKAQAITYEYPVNLDENQVTLDIQPIDQDGATAIIVLNDVTERKRWEMSVRESENMLRTVIHSTKEALICVGQDGLVTIFNPATEEMFGRKKEEMIGQPLDCLMPAEYRERHREYIKDFFAKARANNAIKKPFEVPAVRSDGSVFPMEISLSSGKSEDKQIIIAVARDITERRAVEEEKWRLEAQLQYVQRMETIGTLAGGIAHDFNNLLMAIGGNLSYMRYDMDSSHPHWEELENIERQVGRGARLTSQLLSYAREERYHVKPTDLNELVGETSETFGRTRKGITIHKEFLGDLSVVEVDRGLIAQCLMNIFLNASDAMPGGGSLFLKTRNVSHKHMSNKPYKPKPGKYVLLTIRDTGVGMYKKTINHVFDPFFTTKEVGEGTGLGLASVYGIVKGHDGYISVESKRGRGTTFSMYFPASKEKVEEAAARDEGIFEGNETIMLVDDEEMVLDAVAKILHILGYTVLQAKDGKEAVRIYKSKKDSIDLVIFDMIMPNMGGGTVYDKMKEINHKVKALVSSGYSITGEGREILERDCDAFIQKPFRVHH